jgi:hypothetical protein
MCKSVTYSYKLNGYVTLKILLFLVKKTNTKLTTDQTNGIQNFYSLKYLLITYSYVDAGESNNVQYFSHSLQVCRN